MAAAASVSSDVSVTLSEAVSCDDPAGVTSEGTAVPQPVTPAQNTAAAPDAAIILLMVIFFITYVPLICDCLYFPYMAITSQGKIGSFYL